MLDILKVRAHLSTLWQSIIALDDFFFGTLIQKSSQSVLIWMQRFIEFHLFHLEFPQLSLGYRVSPKESPPFSE